jgi:hypothetical protein
VKSPLAVADGQVTAELQHLTRGLLRDAVRVAKETAIVADGVIGEDLTYTVRPSQGTGVVTRRSRHFITGHFYYELTATSPPDKPLPADAARFVSSLTFEAIVKAHHARTKTAATAPARPAARDARATARPRAAARAASKPVRPADSRP